MKIRFGITEKLIMTLFILFVFFIFSFSYYSFKIQKKMLLSEFDKRAKNMVNSLATSCEYPVLTRNEKLLANIASGIFSQGDIFSCEVKDNDGKALFSMKSDKRLENTREYVVSITTSSILSSNDEMVFLTDPENKKLEKIGEVRLVLSLDYVTREMERQRNVMVWLALIGIFTILLLISFLIKFILGRPVRELVNGTREVATGNLQFRALLTSHDEIGVLATSFNKMIEDLQRITVSRDLLINEISEREKIEKALEKSEDDIRKAYLELKETQKQLLQAEKLSAIGQLASGVAHEVRNPLGIILQGVNYLENKIPSDRQDLSEVLGMIRTGINRANNIISGLNDFSKVSSLSLQPEDIGLIMETSIGLVKAKSRLENINFVIEKKENIPLVVVDKNKMEQVFINILLNAIQAMSSGGEIIIRLYDKVLDSAEKGNNNKGEACFSVGERFVAVEVEDAGCGIPEENLTKVFDPFFTTKGPASGTGLGLSVTQSIVTTHNGLINIESQVGKGTKVTLMLKAVNK